MQAVILAAGRGRRLSSLTFSIPKPLIEVVGKPILGYAIEALENTGVNEILIVTGYKAQCIKNYVLQEVSYKGKIVCLYNPNYKKENAHSLLVSYPYISKYPFLLLMGDHLFSSELILKTVNQSHLGGNFLAVDFNPDPYKLKEATKVLVDEEGKIKAIGKQLKRFNGVDTGFFVLLEEVFIMAEDLVKKKGNCKLSDVFNHLIKYGSGLKACDVSGCFWMDVDTIEDLKRAENLLLRKIPQWQKELYPGT